LSINVARRKRTALYVSLAALMFIVAALSAISARDPDGLAIRTGMILVTVGAAMWLPWQALLPAVIVVWLGPNIGRSTVESYELFNVNMMLELPGLLGLAAMSSVARISLRDLERESVMLGVNSDSVGTDPVTGVFEESQLRSTLEAELSRSRRFGRSFALVLVGIDQKRQRFDYRDEELWQASFAATADLLRGTRNNVDRVYRYGPGGFALILPESGPKDVNGLVKRLRHEARKVKPQEGEPGGPLPAHYGATFFPTCATTVNDMIRRAEIALSLSDNNASRVQLDGAEAPELPPAETLRRAALEAATLQAVASSNAEADTGDESPLRIIEPVAMDEAAPQPIRSVEVPEALPDFDPDVIDEEPVLLRVAETAADEGSKTEAEAPQPVLASTEKPALEAEVTEAAPTPLFAVEANAVEAKEQPNYSAHADAVEVDEEPPFEVFAYRAPEPAVDVYNDNWQAEAPLSVIRRPHPTSRMIPPNGGAVTQQPSVDTVVSDALKQLDDTLELIRSLKQRSA